jgi:hypothetical protein
MIKTSNELTDPPFCYGFIVKTEQLYPYKYNDYWYLRVEDDKWYKIHNEKIHGHIWLKPLNHANFLDLDLELEEEFPHNFNNMLIWIDPLFHLIKMYPEANY